MCFFTYRFRNMLGGKKLIMKKHRKKLLSYHFYLIFSLTYNSLVLYIHSIKLNLSFIKIFDKSKQAVVGFLAVQFQD